MDIFPPTTFQPLLDEIATQLIARGATFAVAETTTGGLVSAALLSIPGASSFFVGGATLYTVAARKTWAGWDDDTARNYLSVPLLPLTVTWLTRAPSPCWWINRSLHRWTVVQRPRSYQGWR